jgi:hypothetical protein
MVSPEFGTVAADGIPNSSPALVLDDRLDHALACKSHSTATFERHQTLARAVMRLALDAGYAASLDSSLLNKRVRLGSAHHLSGGASINRKRPGDVVINDPIDPHCTIAVDVTVVCGKSSSAEDAEKRKKSLYAATVANTPGLSFVPFAITVEGEIGTHAFAFARKLALAIARRHESAHNPQSAAAFVKARLANALASGLAHQLEGYIRGDLPHYMR